MAPTARPGVSQSVVVWRDTTAKGVYFLTNVHDPTDATTLDRRKKGEGIVTKTAPKVAADYNRHMGFVDAMNHTKDSYKTQLTYHRRWYMGVIFYIIDISIINALICYRQLDHPGMSQADFRIELRRQLVMRGGHPPRSPRKRVRLSFDGPRPAIMFSQGPHLVMKNEETTGRRCRECSRQGGDSKSLFYCKTCLFYLHPECFAAWHDPTTQ